MSTSTTLAQHQAAVNFRRADKPPVMPACRNCAHYRYTAEDRMSVKGATFGRSNQHCAVNGFMVTTTRVCDRHEFKHRDRRDA